MLSIIGFILLMIGFLSLVMKMVGVHFSFLFWLENLGGLTAGLIRILMILVGFLLIYVSRTQMDV
jgi:uncharacterized membrane protein